MCVSKFNAALLFLPLSLSYLCITWFVMFPSNGWDDHDTDERNYRKFYKGFNFNKQVLVRNHLFFALVSVIVIFFMGLFGGFKC